MTRRDYAAIAAAFRAELDMRAELEPSAIPEYGAKTAGIVRGVQLVADVLAADSPRFDRGRFELAALGEDHIAWSRSNDCMRWVVEPMT